MDESVLITQGEHATSDKPDMTIKTLLGSCVSCCLWDPLAGVGGMNHMLLAGATQSGTSAGHLAGVNAMEVLINDLLKLGASRDRLKAKAFGGARMVSGLSDIGQSNAQFTLEFLEREGIEVVNQSLGGDQARNIVFWPSTGRAKLRLTENKVAEPVAPPPPKDDGNDLELF